MNRVLDLAFASMGLLVSAPLLAGLALAIKVDSRGPVLFRQTRIGRERRPFSLLKLRTMRVEQPRDSPQITATGDPRITRVGALLRRSKLDELPQLWNILRGDMSLVGPRPEVPRYVEVYRPQWAPLLAVRPGLTDEASLRFRDEERLLEMAHDRDRAYVEVVMPIKLELALEGVARASTLHDLGVLARTALAIVRPRRPSLETVIARAERLITELNERGTS